MKTMEEKKKLQKFLSSLFKLGCVKGFKYFATHMRSREEVVCSILNEPSLPILLSTSTSPSSSFGFHKDPSKPFFPKEPSSILISQKRQRRLSGYGYIDVGLPPASPAASDEGAMDESCTMFLIAGYARYGSPYVWVRTNHDRLVLLPEHAVEKNYPLQLSTTSNWSQSGVEVWDVIAELVYICTSPSPPNPFAVDLDYFDSLPADERVLTSAAMLDLLRCIVASGSHSYNGKVQSDILRVSQCHFRALMEVIKTLHPLSPSPLSSRDDRQSMIKLKEHYQ